jgi:hypothetical protein
MPSSTPLLFIHYGPAPYLRWTLQAARRTNKERRIILLGDEKNCRFARGVAEFFPFEEYARGARLEEFEHVFQPIEGARHHYTKEGGVTTWLKFVFKRWFLIYEFIKSQDIDSFWTFDSDTLLLESLDRVEPRFAPVEATTQCRGECLNGWIGSRLLVERYLDCINELFNDPLYLQAQRERLLHQPTLSFNEMDAFREFCRRKSVQTARASEVIEQETFDDALAIVDDYEPAAQKVLGRTSVKRLWSSPAGHLYIRRVDNGQMVRLLSCNMSWMPDFFWNRLFKLTQPPAESRLLLQ